ncbi:AAA family ATPase [Sphingobium sp.]|uniref:AAA family ATPase n=1 Tax=Sphingobium sp. TaxID=1912891 RepID=UPI003BB52A1E
MRDDAFRDWLIGQGQAASSVSTRVSDARRVENHYGDLDELYERDRLKGVLGALTYSTSDRAASKANPSLLAINGDLYDSLASYRAAVTAYSRFASQDGEDASQADRIRRFALDTVIAPARTRGDFEVELITGDIHRAMQLDNAMPAVCSALGGNKFESLAGVKIIDRQGPANSSTVRLRYSFAAADAIGWAEAELRARFGRPISETGKMIGFALPDSRQIALQRDVRTAQVWVEDDASRPTIPASQVRHYLADQNRHSNLPPRLRHERSGGVSPRRVSVVTVLDVGGLRELLDWYSDGKGGLDRAALDRYRRLFLARYPDFADFERVDGGYYEEERAYKDRLIALTQDAVAGGWAEVEIGSRLLDVLVGRAGAPSGLLGWRTDGRLADLRLAHPDRFELAAGRLACANDVEAGIAAFVADVWPLLAEGQSSKPYSESRNIPTMLAALVQPAAAYGINTEPLQQTAQALLGRKLLGWNAMTAEEYAAVASLTGEIYRIMADEWDWKPRDLWDVQGFVWAVNRADTVAQPDGENVNDATRPERLQMPTNLILYGPPGTGKTFATAREAVRLCDGEAPESENEVRQRYAELAAAGRVRFVTFHQSYSYEDFVEGLRPTTGEAGQESASGGFRLEPVPGVFRELATVAEQAMRSHGSGTAYDMTGRRVFKMSLGRAGSEDHIFDAAVEGGYVVLGWGGDIDWTPFDTYEAIHEKWNELHPGTNGNDANIVQTARFRAEMREGDLIVVSYGNTRFRAIAEVVGPYEFNPTDERDYNHRRAVNWLYLPDEPLPITFYDKPFTMRSCYLLREGHLNREALALLLPGGGDGGSGEPAQFVLICDEINRANISKVFGELITLIEPDKRIGAEYELRLTLPYSKHSFGVPANLHIVGTMNTADRSIALLDTALRRRFTFKEVMPEPMLLREVDELDLSRLLGRLNDRIEYLFDREHQIGHAYLIRCTDRPGVDEVMRHKIIPLLAEYFHEDWGKIAAVLGDPNGERFLVREVLAAPPGFESEYGAERYRWRVRENFSPDAYAGLQ